MSFQENLIRARKARGMTQEELAAMLNVSRQAVSLWDTEVRFPRVERLAEIAELYGCTVRELMDGIFETLDKREAKK